MRAGRARHRLSAVFLDRDGVINRKAPEGAYVTSWREFDFLPGALEGLRLLHRAGLPVIVATNQRGIARGAMTERDLTEIHHRMCEQVAAAGGRIDAIYYCPHAGGCACRKPRPGLFLAAAQELRLDLTETAVVGDRVSDMRAAAEIGALRVLVRAPGEPPPAAESELVPGDASPDWTAEDLAAAARWLLADGAGPDPL